MKQDFTAKRLSDVIKVCRKCGKHGKYKVTHYHNGEYAEKWIHTIVPKQIGPFVVDFGSVCTEFHNEVQS